MTEAQLCDHLRSAGIDDERLLKILIFNLPDLETIDEDILILYLRTGGKAELEMLGHQALAYNSPSSVARTLYSVFK